MAANTPIPLNAFASNPVGAVTQSSGTFTLAQAGTYQVTAILNVPSQSNFDNTFRLLANATPIPSTQTQVSLPSSTGNIVLSAIVISDGTTTVALTATDALNLTGEVTGDMLVSMTFLKLE